MHQSVTAQPLNEVQCAHADVAAMFLLVASQAASVVNNSTLREDVNLGVIIAIDVITRAAC